MSSALSISVNEKLFIRWLIISRDMPEVMAIENASFKDNAWSEERFRDFLRVGCTIGMVAEIGEIAVGYFIYELHVDHIRLINLAVHPEYRGRGMGKQIKEKILSKLDQNRRTKIVVLLPRYLESMKSFFDHEKMEIRFTRHKGVITYDPIFSIMTKNDVQEIQAIEDQFMKGLNKEPRDFDSMISKGTRYGFVARNEADNELLGYILYSRERDYIDLNGEYDLIVRSKCRKQGIGRSLMQKIIEQNLPINVSNINLFCKSQVAFFKAMGVPVPAVERYVTVKWEPKPAA